MKSPKQQPQWHDIIAETLDSKGLNSVADAVRTAYNKERLQRAIIAGIVSGYLTPEHFVKHGVQVAPIRIEPENHGGIRLRRPSGNQNRLLMGSSVLKHSITVEHTYLVADWREVKKSTGRSVRFGNHAYALPLSPGDTDAVSQPFLLPNGYIGESLPLTEAGEPRIFSELGADSADDTFLRLWTRSGYSTEGLTLPVVEVFDTPAETYEDPERLLNDLGRIVTATL